MEKNLTLVSTLMKQ